jgi:signal transduction histidine kinase
MECSVKIWVLSRDREFLDTWAQCWQLRPLGPSVEVCIAAEPGEIPQDSLVVVDGAEALSGLSGGTGLIFAVVDGEWAVDGNSRSIVYLPRRGAWVASVALLAEQVAKHRLLGTQLAEAELRVREQERFAALGRFIIESRHGLGNALTSVLGNSELLLQHGDGMLKQEMRGQLETIHAMSLRIYEVLQRLASLDMEMRLAERMAVRESEPASSAGAGN